MGSSFGVSILGSDISLNASKNVMAIFIATSISNRRRPFSAIAKLALSVLARSCCGSWAMREHFAVYAEQRNAQFFWGFLQVGLYRNIKPVSGQIQNLLKALVAPAFLKLSP